MNRFAVSIFLLCVLMPAGVAGQEHAYRTWTDASGKHTTVARLVEQKAKELTLELKDGRKIVVAVNRLGRADQAYLRTLRRTDGPQAPAAGGRADAAGAPSQAAATKGNAALVRLTKFVAKLRSNGAKVEYGNFNIRQAIESGRYVSPFLEVTIGPEATGPTGLLAALSREVATGHAKGPPGRAGEFVSRLSVAGIELDDTRLNHVGRIATLTKLGVLDLSGTNFGDRHMARLAKASLSLSELNLSGTQVTDRSLQLLGQGKLVLRHNLKLSKTAVTDEGIPHLMNRRFGSLVNVNLDGTQMTPAGIKTLKNRRPRWVIFDKVAPAQARAEAQAELDGEWPDIEGTWKVVREERNGRPVPNSTGRYYQFARFAQQAWTRQGLQPDGFQENLTEYDQTGVPVALRHVSIDSSKTPKRITLGMVKGDKAVPVGIYRAEGGQLTLTLIVERTASRPTDFVSQPGDGLALLTLERSQLPALADIAGPIANPGGLTDEERILGTWATEIVEVGGVRLSEPAAESVGSTGLSMQLGMIAMMLKSVWQFTPEHVVAMAFVGDGQTPRPYSMSAGSVPKTLTFNTMKLQGQRVQEQTVRYEFRSKRLVLYVPVEAPANAKSTVQDGDSPSEIAFLLKKLTQ